MKYYRRRMGENNLTAIMMELLEVMIVMLEEHKINSQLSWQNIFRRFHFNMRVQELRISESVDSPTTGIRNIIYSHSIMSVNQNSNVPSKRSKSAWLCATIL